MKKMSREKHRHLLLLHAYKELRRKGISEIGALSLLQRHETLTPKEARRIRQDYATTN